MSTALLKTQMRGKVRNIFDQLLNHPIESLCDAFFVFYALWTLIWIASYLTNLPFNALSPLFLLAMAAAAAPLAFKPPLSRERASTVARPACHDTLILLVFIFTGIVLTLILHRPDADDELYLGMAFSLLAHVDQPIQESPAYVGPGSLAINNFSGIGAYEPFRAMVSHLTGTSLLNSYYLIVPSFMSALTVIVTYRLLRVLTSEGWIFGLLFFFVIMLAWGDAHRTLANFGFVRMFQGKAVLVSAVVPALFLYFFLSRKAAHAGYHRFLLAAACISGVGFSRGGIIIGPLVIALLLIASIDFQKIGKTQKQLLLVVGASAVALMVVAYNYEWTLMNPSQLVYTGRRGATTTTNLEMIELTMGSGFRAGFLLICVGLGFLFVKNKKVRFTYRNFLIIVFLLLLIPWTSNFFAKTLQEYLSWRWMWVVPVPVLASVTVGGAVASIRHSSNVGVALVVFMIIAVIFTAASPRLVVSRENYTSVRWPDAKLDGNSIYLRAYGKRAKVKNESLKLEGFEKGF